MPRYDNRCACGVEFESEDRMVAPPARCPSCGSAETCRLITSAPAPVFKGSGFYETDYRRADPSFWNKPAPERKTVDRF